MKTFPHLTYLSGVERFREGTVDKIMSKVAGVTSCFRIGTKALDYKL